MDKARSTLDGFVARLENPQRGETFSIEASFRAEDNSPIYLWIGDVSYKSGSFTGTVTTHPKKAAAIDFGDAATVPKQDVTDWMILKSGHTEGGFTIDVLMKREGSPQ